MSLSSRIASRNKSSTSILLCERRARTISARPSLAQLLTRSRRSRDDPFSFFHTTVALARAASSRNAASTFSNPPVAIPCAANMRTYSLGIRCRQCDRSAEIFETHTRYINMVLSVCGAIAGWCYCRATKDTLYVRERPIFVSRLHFSLRTTPCTRTWYCCYTTQAVVGLSVVSPYTIYLQKLHPNGRENGII